MKLRALFCFSAVAVAAACGGTSTPPNNSPYIDGFDPPELKQGLTRFITPTIDNIEPGQELIWCQWLSAPVTEDTDIVSIEGLQSAGGHHIVLYATTIQAPVGTSRECLDSDQLSLRYLGGVGAEGTGGVVLPPGVVYRLPKGWGIMANSHFLNVSREKISGQGVVDLEMRPADPEAKVASLFANVSLDINLAAKQTSTLDVVCDVKEELSLISALNHMHRLGTSITTELIHADGTKEPLIEDRVWLTESEFAPRLKSWDPATPKILKVGDRIHTNCNWNNPDDTEVGFPREMCVMVGFYLGNGLEIQCVSNSWEHG